jgi:hypothetical protein
MGTSNLGEVINILEAINFRLIALLALIVLTSLSKVLK